MPSVSISGESVGPVTNRIAQRFKASGYPAIRLAATGTIYGNANQLCVVTDTQLVLALDQRDFRLPLARVQSWDGRTLRHSNGSEVDLALDDPQKASILHELLSDANLAAAAAAVETRSLPEGAVTTGPSHPAVPDPAVLGQVVSSVVMTRHVFSDMGSDLKSTVGGRLRGIESAVDGAWAEASLLLRQRAAAMGADAVVALDVSVQTVADKAQLILLVGTAVRTREPRPHRPA